MALTEYHGYATDGVQWRLVPAGVEIDGSGVERTRGQPVTVTRVWETYGDAIDRAARTYRVPCAHIIATICAESGGRPDAVRLEPGYVSDEATPRKVSIGLMQTLLSTAQETMRMSFARDWLLAPANSIIAGTAYMAGQSSSTSLDPPLVAAAYNAGGLYRNDGGRNRWKLRQFPIGTGEHVDRWVRFLNDAVFMLSRHGRAAAVGLDGLVVGSNAPRSAPAAPSRPRALAIEFGQNADPQALTAYSRGVLEDILRATRLHRAVISSTSRNPADQARVMYDNLEKHGVAAQKRLYGRGGDTVIDVYAKEKAAGRSPTDVKAAMEQKIREIGPTTVSRHASDPTVLNVFDVAPSSITDHRGFEEAVRAERRVTTFLLPPTDPGYHLEIPQPR